jgi:hypothetical protein
MVVEKSGVAVICFAASVIEIFGYVSVLYHVYLLKTTADTYMQFSLT